MLQTPNDGLPIEYAFLKSIFDNFRRPVALTLTLKQAQRIYRRQNGRKAFLSAYDPLDELKAQKTVRRFLDRLSRKLLIRSDYDLGSRIPAVAVCEHSARDRLHYHLVVDLSGKPIEEAHIRKLWAQMPFGASQVDIKFGCDEGWLSYILKKTDYKFHYVPGIDWENCFPAAA